ncbi:MAG: transposase [Firmicutes bacterium]|nr:transposase [Bacillota bacterium]
MNAYIESFHAILGDECYSRHEFQDFEDVYRIVSDYMDYYNNRRRHGSINNMAQFCLYSFRFTSFNTCNFKLFSVRGGKLETEPPRKLSLFIPFARPKAVTVWR